MGPATWSRVSAIFREAYPALSREDKTVEGRLVSNLIEFDGIEIGVIQLLPDIEKFNGIAVAQPVLNDVVGSLVVFVARNIGYADVVIALLRHYRDSSARSSLTN
jgi:glyceraldehyde-3-phosphate dehydrogenase/erythrose-4-phosphate dehydrogenase